MAANTNPIFIKSFNNKGVVIQNAEGTELQTIFTAGTDGSRVITISVIHNDSGTVVVDLYYNDGNTDYLLGSLSISTGSGNKSLLNKTTFEFLRIDNNSNPYIQLKSGESLKAALQSAITSGKKCTIVVYGGDY